MKYITLHETQAAYEAVKNALSKPQVAVVKENDTAHYAPLVKVNNVLLNKNYLTLVQNYREKLVATVLPENASDKSVIWSTSNSNILTVDSNGLVAAIGIGSATITVTTIDGSYTAQCVVEVTDRYAGHDYVYIGGRAWATMNVGAESTSGNGLYFQWGDTSGYTDDQIGSGSGKKYFGWSDYKFTNDGGASMTKYGSIDNKSKLELEDDGVAVNWGGKWRIPNSEEIDALSASVKTTWTDNYQGSGVSGVVLTDKTYTTQKLFFPTAGYCYNGSIQYMGKEGYCWSTSRIYPGDDSSLCLAYAYNDGSGRFWNRSWYRYYGLTLRGIIGEDVSSVSLSENTLTVSQGNTEKLVATVLPSNVHTKSVIWTSSDNSIAVVDDNGVVSGVSVGNATITVTTVDGGHTAQCSIEVIYTNVSGVTLSKNTLSVGQGTSDTLIPTVLPLNASNKSVIWSSSDESVATVDGNGVVTAVGGVGDIATITVTTVEGSYTAQCVITVKELIDGHEFVEIGDVKWATMNIGATAVTDYGLYFQWGDSRGYTAEQVGSALGQKYFGWADYKYGDGTSSPSKYGMRKYSGGQTLEPIDDGVAVNWGGRWRMPTSAECAALVAATTSAWTNDYQSSGVAGLILTAKDGSGAELFFPAAGNCNNGNVKCVGLSGSCWSSTQYRTDARNAHMTSFNKVSAAKGYTSRYNGFTLRGVVVDVKSVSLNKNELNLKVWTSEALTATVLPSNATDKSIIWSSSDESVATVNSNGLVSGISVGNATITVTTVNGGHTAQCAVNVADATHVTDISLNKNSLTLEQNYSETLVATILPSDATNKTVTWTSSDESVATVNSNGLVSGISIGNATITVTTFDGGHTAQCVVNVFAYPTIDGHEYVEIGGRKWATMNIGANKASDTGLYFAWGDTSGYTAAQVGSGDGKKYFGWADYKYGDGTSSPGTSGFTKYNSTDGKTTLDAEDDGVVVNWGGRWRMPTTAELQALGAAVNTTWTTNYQGTGVAGLVCTAKDGSGAKLFFPAAGSCEDGSVSYVGSSGEYWSSSLTSSDVRTPYYFVFGSGYVNWKYSHWTSWRCRGFILRGIIDE